MFASLTEQNGRTVRVFNYRMQQIAIHAKHDQSRYSTDATHLDATKINGLKRGIAYRLGKVRAIGPQAHAWAEIVTFQGRSYRLKNRLADDSSSDSRPASGSKPASAPTGNRRAKPTTAACAQAKDDKRYADWKQIHDRHCRAAGVPVLP